MSPLSLYAGSRRRGDRAWPRNVGKRFYTRHCERSEAIQCGLSRTGLLRFARNDGEGQSTAFTIRLALVPPKPKLLLSAALTLRFYSGRAWCRERVCQSV